MSAPRVAGFDPVRAGDAASAAAYAKIYEGLLQFDPVSRPYRVIPALAEGMPEVSGDGLTVRIRVRPGIYFSDDPCFRETGGKGRELVAEDFVYSIKRVADAATASPGYWAFRDRIVGLDAFRAASASGTPADYDMPVEGLRAVGRHELEIRLLRPYPQLFWILAMHYAYAVPREAVEFYGDAFVQNPVGTGPFVLEEWRRNYRMVFIRNPKWAESGRQEPFPAELDPGGEMEGLPGLDRLVQLVVTDPSTQWQMFLRGELAFSGVSRDHWDLVMAPDGNLRSVWRDRGIRRVPVESLNVNYIGFNMDDPVVGSNRALRQAMALAFDTVEWAAFHNGQVVRPASPVPPGVTGYAPIPDLYAHDLDRARERLVEAGYPGGIDPATGRRLNLTLELADPDNPDVRQAADLFVQFMDRIGIVVRPSYNNRPAFFEKLSRRQAQMFRLSWVADYPDAQNFLQLFASAHVSPGSNRANFRHPEADRLYEEIASMPDGPERTERCAAMARIVMEECPWILTHIPVPTLLAWEWVGGYSPHPFSYGFEKYWFARDPERRPGHAVAAP